MNKRLYLERVLATAAIAVFALITIYNGFCSLANTIICFTFTYFNPSGAFIFMLPWLVHGGWIEIARAMDVTNPKFTVLYVGLATTVFGVVRSILDPSETWFVTALVGLSALAAWFRETAGPSLLAGLASRVRNNVYRG